MTQHWDYIAKLVVIGDSGTGKSSVSFSASVQQVSRRHPESSFITDFFVQLTIRLCENRFVQQHDVTIGVEFGSRIVPVGPPELNNLTHSANPDRQDQKYMKLSLWDTAGQETYKSITRSYFRGASGALLVFDISRRKTFSSVTSWLNDLRQIADENIVIVLVGNKSDLAEDSSHGGTSIQQDQRQVTSEEAWEWCRSNRIFAYIETSAKNGDGVEAAFLEVSNKIYQNIEDGRYDLNDRRSGVKSSSSARQPRRPEDGVVLRGDGSHRTQGWSSPCC